jgi:hypothetical protein
MLSWLFFDCLSINGFASRDLLKKRHKHGQARAFAASQLGTQEAGALKSLLPGSIMMLFFDGIFLLCEEDFLGSSNRVFTVKSLPALIE